MEVGKEGLSSLCSVSGFTFSWGAGYKRRRRQASVEGYRLKTQGQGCEPSVMLEIPVLLCGQAQ